ncbi:hypothetical protein ETH_00003705 [Eimeria tenella]|uniref:Uncharacterized protein n=1 Tax=Eimeria tenella TaxID=5802 RepID=U6KNG1_EIMTE|nr:hypothetical protein ETH_00003705 [Eimeria tenella]CDJ39657.1 hypothetical protein ETH_00003705 [Eimeria tenella]|eukprot:XP_013230412.1 hypothetical protein ETH_00003705 [Eimeria tenella]
MSPVPLAMTIPPSAQLQHAQRNTLSLTTSSSANAAKSFPKHPLLRHTLHIRMSRVDLHMTHPIFPTHALCVANSAAISDSHCSTPTKRAA